MITRNGKVVSRVLVIVIAILMILPASVFLSGKRGMVGENDFEETIGLTMKLPTAGSRGGSPLGSPIDTISKTIEIPAGKQYFVYFDNATKTLMEMQLPDLKAGLPQNAKDAVDRAPNWLKTNLSRRLGELSEVTIDVGDRSTPTFADVDGDGDLDLTVGESAGALKYYENMDGALHYYERIDVWIGGVFNEDNTMFSGIDVGTYSDPAFADLDNDGDEDLVIGAYDGKLHYYTNDAGTWTSQGVLKDGGGGDIDVGSYSTPVFADMDDDNDLDLTIGKSDGTLNYYKNTGTVSSATWTEDTTMYSGIDVGDYSNPALADMDDDGDIDLTSGESLGTLKYYRNDAGTWVEVTNFYAGWNGAIDVGDYSAPALADMNFNYVYDLTIGRNDGRLNYYENTGTAIEARWLVWANTATGFSNGNDDEYYVDDSAVFLKYRTATQRLNDYADMILDVPQKMVDELAFTIAHSSYNSLTHGSCYSDVYRNNSESLYYNDQFIDYADIIDYDLGTQDQWSTVRYNVSEEGIKYEYELPKDIYYWYVVHPRVSYELPTFINPTVKTNTHGGAASPPDGKFWRWYFFNEQAYVTTASNNGWPSDTSIKYPKDEEPPIMKDKLQGIDLFWTCHRYPTGYSTPSGYADNGHDNKRDWTAHYRVLRASSSSGEMDTWEKGGLTINVGCEHYTPEDRDKVSDPSVILDGSTYKMWYTGDDGTNSRILYATSADGDSWTKSGVVLDKGGVHDSVHAAAPSVLKETNYKMWYSGYDGSNWRVLYATSNDGTTWTKEGLAVDIGDIYDSEHAKSPTVIKDGSTYKMWYSGYDGSNWRVLYATSTDGTTWTKEGLAVDYGQNPQGYDSESVFDPIVLINSTTYHMWYTGSNSTEQRILHATSSDGLAWTHDNLAVDIGKYSGYDHPYASSPTVLWNGTTYRMWYSGYDDYHDHALEQVAHWVSLTLALNAQDDDDDNRPRQPVRICYEHNGNCGELSDLTVAAFRTAMIPAIGTMSAGQDHCWNEWYERGWHQNDQYWSNSASVIDNFENYHYGWNRDWGAMYSERGDTKMENHVHEFHWETDHNDDGYNDRGNVSVTVKDANGNPVDGVKVSWGDWNLVVVLWMSYFAFATYTDPDGVARFNTSECRQGDQYDDGIRIDVDSKYGGGSLNPAYANRYKICIDPPNLPLYEYEFPLPSGFGRTIPRPHPLATQVTPPPSGNEYKMDITYQTNFGFQKPANSRYSSDDDGTNYHWEEIYTGIHLDSFIVNDSGLNNYLKGLSFDCHNFSANTSSKSDVFEIPATGDWYYVLSNQDTVETTKIVNITVNLYEMGGDLSVGPPTDIDAVLEGASCEHVNITWTLSMDDGGGENDVAGYDIYYNQTYTKEDYNKSKTYTKIGSVNAGISYFVHKNDGLNTTNSYYYITAKDSSGNTEATVDQAGKFVREMPSGRQLASIPLVQSDTAITEVLKTIEGNYNYVQWYDPLDAADHWKTYSTTKPSGFNDLLDVDHKMALWITMTAYDNLTVAGKVPNNTTIQLYTGYNFVSYASFIDRTVGDALSGIPYEQVEGFDETNSPYYLKILADTDMMKAGRGYWIRVSEDCTWTVEN